MTGFNKSSLTIYLKRLIFTNIFLINFEIKSFVKNIAQGHFMFPLFGLPRAASVERVQKTLQQKIYTFMNEKQTRCFINVLPDIVFTYNSSRHSTTKW